MKTFKGTPVSDLLKNIPKYKATTDYENCQTFDVFGTSKSAQYRHKCVLCEDECCIDNSISSRGHNLICIRCVYTYFDGDYAIAAKWCRGEI